MFSTRKYSSFDIELYDELFPDGNKDAPMLDLRTLRPSTGAYCTGLDNAKFYDDDPYMSKDTAKKLVLDMLKLYHMGYIPFGWNTLSFDFQLLAHYSGLYEECATLALNGVDAMFLVVAHKGYFLGLDKALVGAGIESKLKFAKFNDGTTGKISGAQAPLFWRNGEFDAVRSYLEMDVVQPLKLARDIEATGSIRWTASSGKYNTLRTKMLTVKEALELPVPNTQWMSDPKPRTEYYDWIPSEILRREGVLPKSTAPNSSDIDELF